MDGHCLHNKNVYKSTPLCVNIFQPLCISPTTLSYIYIINIKTNEVRRITKINTFGIMQLLFRPIFSVLIAVLHHTVYRLHKIPSDEVITQLPQKTTPSVI
jgi:hypothetical protein